MEDFDLSESSDNPTDPSERAVLNNETKAPNRTSLDSIIPYLPPEGQDWLDSLNRYCRWALEHDLRFAGPDLFVKHWEFLRDTLENLERELGPSDYWK
jgi:hypothetical protein